MGNTRDALGRAVSSGRNIVNSFLTSSTTGTSFTDHRGVVIGADPREAFNDGFDVLQCRAALPGGTFGPDTCPNAGGLNQNIYGTSVTIP